MTFRNFAAALLSLFCFDESIQAAPGHYEELKLQWSELSGHIAGHRINLGLLTGSHLEGDVISVAADSIEIKVRKSSDRQTIAKGLHVFPRSSIALIELHSKTVKARVVGASIGAAVLTTSMAVGYKIQGYGGVFLFLIGGAVGVCVMVAGYFIGNEHDRKLTRMILLPD